MWRSKSTVITKLQMNKVIIIKSLLCNHFFNDLVCLLRSHRPNRPLHNRCWIIKEPSLFIGQTYWHMDELQLHLTLYHPGHQSGLSYRGPVGLMKTPVSPLPNKPWFYYIIKMNHCCAKLFEYYFTSLYKYLQIFQISSIECFRVPTAPGTIVQYAVIEW